MGDYPIAGLKHVARDLSLDRVYVVHQRGRRNNATEENGCTDQEQD
jgi:hypothetical protein